MAAGVAVSYLTLRPRSGSAEPAAGITAVGELEAVGESLGESVVPEQVTVPASVGRPQA
jgi:hypothetical protein